MGGTTSEVIPTAALVLRLLVVFATPSTMDSNGRPAHYFGTSLLLFSHVARRRKHARARAFRGQNSVLMGDRSLKRSDLRLCDHKFARVSKGERTRIMDTVW